MRTVQKAVDSRRVTFLATDISADGGKIILTAGVPQATGNDEEQMLLALREIVSTPGRYPASDRRELGPGVRGRGRSQLSPHLYRHG